MFNIDFFLVGKLTMNTFNEQFISRLSLHILLGPHCGLKCTFSSDHLNQTNASQPSARLRLPARTSFHPTGKVKWRIFCSITKYPPLWFLGPNTFSTLNSLHNLATRGSLTQTSPLHFQDGRRRKDAPIFCPQETWTSQHPREPLWVCLLTEMWFLNALGTEKCYGKCIYLAPSKITPSIPLP